MSRNLLALAAGSCHAALPITGDTLPYPDLRISPEKGFLTLPHDDMPPGDETSVLHAPAEHDLSAPHDRPGRRNRRSDMVRPSESHDAPL